MTELPRKITMEDIAKKVGVSKALVSRALSGKYGVSDKMRTHIRLTALEMGYTFQVVNRPIHQTKTIKIAIVVSCGTLHDDRFYFQMISGIEKFFDDHDIQFGLKIFEDIPEPPYLQSVDFREFDGFLLLGKLKTEVVLSIISTGLPSVLIDTYEFEYRIDRVTTNNFGMAYMASSFLYEQGHRHMAFVGSGAYSSSFDERRRGINTFTQQHEDIRLDNLCNKHSNDTLPVDIYQLEEYLCSKDRASAFFCANDVIATTLYEMAYRHHVRIPEDISVIGFDNIVISEQLNPALTTIAVPKTEIGYLGAKRIIDKIINKDTTIQYIQIDGKIIVRNSVSSHSL